MPGQRAHGAADRDARADALIDNGLTAGRLRGDARLPDEERLRHDGAPGSAARLRARFAVVRHRRVHRAHARRAAEADARARQRGDQAASSTADHLSVVIVTKDAAGSEAGAGVGRAVADRYDGEKPKALLDEDKVIGALKLNIAADKIRITPIAEVFAQ